MDSPEPSIDERPTEEGREGREAVCTTRTGRREPGQRGSLPAKQSPQVWLAKAEGPDRVCSDSKRDLASGRSEVNSSAQKAGWLEDKGRESC